MTSDYFLKPLLAVVFNGFLQPPLTLVQNIFTSVSDMLEPLTVLLSNILKPFADCLRAFRFVEVKYLNKEAPCRQNFQGQSGV